MKALDLFCGGGGAGLGLRMAGFDVLGIDHRPQPHYPFRFVQTDVRDLAGDLAREFDLIWASPPCQRFSNGANAQGTGHLHPNLIGATRELLEMSGRPYVIENVETAPIRTDVFLCGSMFGLRLIRHRIFEIGGFTASQPAHAREQHHPRYVTVAGSTGVRSNRDGARGRGTMDDWKEAMGIDWLPMRSLREAIPPLYSWHIAKALRVTR